MTSKVVALVTCDGCGKSEEAEADVRASTVVTLPSGWVNLSFSDTLRGQMTTDVHATVECAHKALDAFFARPLAEHPEVPLGEGRDVVTASFPAAGDECPVSAPAHSVCVERMSTERAIRNGIRSCRIHGTRGHAADPALADAIKAGESDYVASST